MGLMVTWFLLVNDCRVDADTVVIRTGPFTFRRRLQQLEAVVWSDDPRHPSARRHLRTRSLVLVFKTTDDTPDDHVVTPREPGAFVAALRNGNPGFLVGEGVPRRPEPGDVALYR